MSNLADALREAIRQAEHDMMPTGEEVREWRQALAAHEAAKPGPVAWSVTINGAHCGNLFSDRLLAEAQKSRMDAAWPGDVRRIVALGEFAAPVADAAKPEPDSVPVPQNADQAAGMVSLGIAWLKEHAPERLKPAPVAVASPLSDEQINKLWHAPAIPDRIGWIDFETVARAIEAHHGIKEKP